MITWYVVFCFSPILWQLLFCSFPALFMNPPLTRYYPRYYRKMCYCIFQQMTWLGGNVETKLWRLCRFMTQKHSQLNCWDFSNEANIIFAHFPDTFLYGRVTLGSVFFCIFSLLITGLCLLGLNEGSEFWQSCEKARSVHHPHSISVSLLFATIRILLHLSFPCILSK